ncbi:MAG TPA: DUF58 domain-containing protein [Thermomicrobiales bacterium]|nr:DUF58 domain-containing protein [Thermomicrobiales bacterium]
MDDGGWIDQRGRDDRARELLAVTVIAAVILAALGQPLLVLLCLLVAVVLVAALVWQRYGLANVAYTRMLSATRAFPGEELTIELAVENRKLLPLPWLEVRDELPAALDYTDLAPEPSAKPGVVIGKLTYTLGPYQRVRRRYRLRCRTRGIHAFGPATLRTSDVFGLATREETVPGEQLLLVYPEIVALDDLGIPPADPFGDARSHRPVWEDPLEVAGIRPYVAGDPPRRLHWRASARSGALLSRRLDRTAAPVVAVFIDVNTFDHFWEGIDSALLERVISTGASLLMRAVEERRQVGLFVNAPLRGGERIVRIRPSRHPGQLTRCLEALALIIAHTGDRIETLVAREARDMPPGATIVVVTGHLTSALEQTVARLHRAGRSIVCVTIGARPTLVPRGGLAVHVVGVEERDDDMASAAQA